MLLAEFEERLNAILGDPEAMGQIVSIAKALTGEGGGETAPPPPEDAGEAPDPPVSAGAGEDPAPEGPSSPAQPDWSALLGMLGGGGSDSPLSALGNMDPKLIQAAVTLFSEYSAPDDQKAALLNALKPFLKPERQAKVEKAMHLARLARVIRAALGLFQSSREEGGDV